MNSYKKDITFLENAFNKDFVKTDLSEIIENKRTNPFFKELLKEISESKEIKYTNLIQKGLRELQKMYDNNDYKNKKALQFCFLSISELKGIPERQRDFSLDVFVLLSAPSDFPVPSSYKDIMEKWEDKRVVEKNIPHIQIKYNQFLDPIFIQYCKSAKGWDNWIPPTKEIILHKVDLYKKEWKKNETKILTALYKVTGLTFTRNFLDIHIVSGNPRAFSRPIVIHALFKPQFFVSILLHELIHELWTENIDKVYPTIFKEMFPNEESITQSHVVLDAILEYIYTDIVKDKNVLQREKERAQEARTSGYVRAWEIVEELGYRDIINSFVSKLK